jgi:RecA/RadA recombinase
MGSIAHRSLARLPPEVFAFGNVSRDDICNKLRNRVVSVGALLQLSAPTLLQALDPLLTHQECLELIRRVGNACAPKSSTALELLQQRATQCIPTGMTALDSHLRGGIRIGSLTELVGAPAVGKTQCAMQLCVLAAHLGFGTIYVDTEQKLSIERLKEISVQKRTAMQLGCTREQVLANVTVHAPTSTKDLLVVLSSLEDEILLQTSSSLPVRLLIVDSIAAPARRDFVNAAERAAAVIQCAQQLKKLADECELAVVVINQVSSSSDSEREPRAALGTSWHHCVSTRIQLEHIQNATVRRASVVKSNVVGWREFGFQVDTVGVVDANLGAIQTGGK